MADILISGMEMPKKTKGITIFAIRPDGMVEDVMGCYIGKAIPVPDHGRLIDADMMERECCQGCTNEFHKYANCIDCALANAPTVVPASRKESQ